MSATDNHRVDSAHEPPLWESDKGSLTYNSRRALVQLLKGPLVRAHKEPVLWSAIISDEDNLRARLHEVFLELVVDEGEGFAFTRMVEEETLPIPQVLRTDKLKHNNRFNAAIKRIRNEYSLLSATETEGRYEVSPVLRQLFDAATVTAIRDEYARLAESEGDQEEASDD